MVIPTDKETKMLIHKDTQSMKYSKDNSRVLIILIWFVLVLSIDVEGYYVKGLAVYFMWCGQAKLHVVRTRKYKIQLNKAGNFFVSYCFATLQLPVYLEPIDQF